MKYVKNYKFIRKKKWMTQKKTEQSLWNGNSQKRKCIWPVNTKQNAWSLRKAQSSRIFFFPNTAHHPVWTMPGLRWGLGKKKKKRMIESVMGRVKERHVHIWQWGWNLSQGFVHNLLKSRMSFHPVISLLELYSSEILTSEHRSTSGLLEVGRWGMGWKLNIGSTIKSIKYVSPHCWMLCDRFREWSGSLWGQKDL